MIEFLEIVETKTEIDSAIKSGSKITKIECLCAKHKSVRKAIIGIWLLMTRKAAIIRMENI